MYGYHAIISETAAIKHANANDSKCNKSKPIGLAPPTLPPTRKAMHAQLRPELQPAPLLRRLVREVHPEPAHAAFVVCLAGFVFLEEGDAGAAELAPPGCDAAPEPADAAAGAVDLFVLAAARRGGSPFHYGWFGRCRRFCVFGKHFDFDVDGVFLIIVLSLGSVGMGWLRRVFLDW